MTDREARSLFMARPGTDDLRVWREVYEENCYGLPDDLAGSIVVDVGGHIGAFSAACAARLGIAGAALHAAIWRSDGWPGELHLSPAGEQTGGRSTSAWEAAEPVPWFALDDVLGWLARVDLLKVDCEGGEYPIVYTSRRLTEVPWILGESHDLGENAWRMEGLEAPWPFTGDGLEACLRERGYLVERLHDFGWLRTFDARRER
ncbi:MAG: FkbM family methyltransferase [Armatimonadetes bacterium]|nr:FkbM family methyltransferase [Armatimonadota bacterium]